MAKEINTRLNQTLLDIAIQETGGIDSVFEIAMDNGVGITEEITPGTKLKIKQETVNAVVLEYYQNNRLFPATGFIPKEEALLTEDSEAITTEDGETIIY